MKRNYEEFLLEIVSITEDVITASGFMTGDDAGEDIFQ